MNKLTEVGPDGVAVYPGGSEFRDHMCDMMRKALSSDLKRQSKDGFAA